MSTPTNTAGRVGPTGDDIDGDVQRLADQGHGRNAVARQLGVSNRRVDSAADRLGITWSREQTAKATRARLADSQSELSTIFSEAAAIAGHRLIAELGKPAPDPSMVRALAYGAGISADKVAHLATKLGVETTDAGIGAIHIFSKSLDAAYAQLIEEESDSKEQDQ